MTTPKQSSKNTKVVKSARSSKLSPSPASAVFRSPVVASPASPPPTELIDLASEFSEPESTQAPEWKDLISNKELAALFFGDVIEDVDVDTKEKKLHRLCTCRKEISVGI
jgi:hypothetical protein